MDIIGLSFINDPAIQKQTRLQMKQRVYKRELLLKGGRLSAATAGVLHSRAAGKNPAADAAVSKMIGSSDAALAQVPSASPHAEYFPQPLASGAAFSDGPRVSTSSTIAF
jgi:hypothetical protein